MKQRGLFDDQEPEPAAQPSRSKSRVDAQSKEPDAPEKPVETAAPAPPVAQEVANVDRGPVDSDARRLAVTTFDRPIMLEAGAGTGKTATLVARVLQWCLGPGWAEVEESGVGLEDVGVRVLRGVGAITFTEAAAAEMSTRVGQALAQVQRVAAVSPLDVDALPRGLVAEELDPTVLHERASALRAGLDHLNVSTIHAFCRRLLSTYPLDCGLDPSFEVDATFSRTVVAVRTTIEAYLLEAWGETVDEDLVELARVGVGPPEIEAALFELIEAGARSEDLEADPIAEELIAPALTELTAAAEALADAAEPLRALKSFSTPFSLAALDATRVALSTEPRGTLADLCASFEEAWFEAGAKPWNHLKRNWCKEKLLKGEGKLVEDEGVAIFAAATRFRAALEPFLDLDPVTLDRARRVVARILARIEDVLRREGVATFADLLLDARRLLEDHPEVARRERRRLRQLLVDEFQDTDEVQCAVVRALGLSDSSGESDGPSLFLVGDPKQSIFAWRNADLKAYDDFKQDVVTAGGEVLSLIANFRSRSAILTEVDRVIAPVMVEEYGVQPAFTALEAGRSDAHESPPDGASPRVEYWLSWTPGEDDLPQPGGNREATYDVEARAIASDIQRQAQLDPKLGWGDFALVFRAQTDIEPYLRELRERAIPYEVQADRKYYRRREILDATSLVRAVLDPHDHIALVAVLRSPSVGVPDAALPPLWEAGLPSLLSALRGPDEERLAKIDAAIAQALERVPTDVPGLAAVQGWSRTLSDAVRSLGEARRSFQHDSADRFVDRLRSAFLIDATEAARYLGGYRLANLDRFFRDLERMLEENAGDGAVVLRTLRNAAAREDRSEGSRPGDEERAAVAVMTVHGSKGLEFAHVYLAQMHKGGRGNSEDTNAFERRGDRIAYRLFDRSTPTWVAAKQDRALSEAAERVRLLYVAMTRAKERLIVLGDLDPGARQKVWKDSQRFSDLLHRRAGLDLAAKELLERRAAEDEAAFVDEDGVAWSLALTIGDEPGVQQKEPEVHEDGPTLAVDARLLAERRPLAREHEARPFHSVASHEGHVEEAESRARRRYSEGAELPEGEERSQAAAATEEPLGRVAAQAVGTAVHRVLEELDLADVDADLAGRLGGLEQSLANEVLPDVLDRAVERARALLEGFRTNGLCDRLVGLADQIVARELSVLASPADVAGATGATGAVAFTSGAIDLLYRDAETNELVIADYKTDRVEPGEEVTERASSYRGQGAAYVEALTAALGLESPPRFELWFLHAGVVEQV